MSERLTRWEGRDSDGTPRAVLAKRDGSWVDNLQEALRKLARYEDMEEPKLPPLGKPMTDEEMASWLCRMIKNRMTGEKE